MQHQEQEEQEPSFEAMLHAIMPLYTALLQAIAALGFRCVRACVGGCPGLGRVCGKGGSASFV